MENDISASLRFESIVLSSDLLRLIQSHDCRKLINTDAAHRLSRVNEHNSLCNLRF